MKNIFVAFFLLFIKATGFAQLVPSKEENIDFISTFSKGAGPSWGDDDHVQIYFFAVKKESKSQFYIRLFDPEVSGMHDQINKEFNSKTSFTVYGGKSCYSNKDARAINPVGKYKSGVVLKTKSFSNEKEYDNAWYTMGPFNPQEGEWDAELDSYVFKIIVEGGEGDDGNMYRFFFSTKDNENVKVEGGNAFAYEISFRLINKKNEAAHLYPFVDNKVVSISQYNFDFDLDGDITLTTLKKKLHKQVESEDGNWKFSKNDLTKDELNSSLNIQFVKQGAKTNDMTFYIVNQYNVALPMFSSPLGGLPKYKYKIDIQTQFDVK